MLTTVKGCIGRAFMHILFVHYSAALLADTPSIGVTRVVVCMAYSFLLQSQVCTVALCSVFACESR